MAGKEQGRKLIPGRSSFRVVCFFVSASTRNAMPEGLCRGSPRIEGRCLVWRTDIKELRKNYLSLVNHILLKDIVKDTLWIVSFIAL